MPVPAVLAWRGTSFIYLRQKRRKAGGRQPLEGEGLRVQPVVAQPRRFSSPPRLHSRDLSWEFEWSRALCSCQLWGQLAYFIPLNPVKFNRLANDLNCDNWNELVGSSIEN